MALWAGAALTQSILGEVEGTGEPEAQESIQWPHSQSANHADRLCQALCLKEQRIRCGSFI